MGTRLLAAMLALLVGLLVDGLISRVASWPLRAMVGLVVTGAGTYFGYRLLKQIKEGDL